MVIDVKCVDWIIRSDLIFGLYVFVLFAKCPVKLHIHVSVMEPLISDRFSFIFTFILRLLGTFSVIASLIFPLSDFFMDVLLFYFLLFPDITVHYPLDKADCRPSCALENSMQNWKPTKKSKNKQKKPCKAAEEERPSIQRFECEIFFGWRLIGSKRCSGLVVVASFWANCGPWGKGLAHCHLYKM